MFKPISRRLRLFSCALLAAALLNTRAQALGLFDIVITPGSGLSGNAAALAAMNRAAQEWEAFISDPITITINADLSALGPGILGSTSSVFLQTTYTSGRDALVADAADEADDSIVAFLPTAAQFSAFVPIGSSLNNALVATKANFKALGFANLDINFGVSDASVVFSTNFAFDFDNSDGVTPGSTDFQSVVSHEIGHVLGFVSVVDEINAGDATISMNPLDLFRFSDDPQFNPATPLDFTNQPRNFLPGESAVFDDLANEFAFSTGLTNANFPGTDGRQASHWKADELTGIHIGILDPTLATGVSFGLTYADLRSLDVVGYEINPLIPSPVASAVGLLGLLALAAARRRD